jgi:hypothetical protein
MKLLGNLVSTSVVLVSGLAALAGAQQLQLNYYNDNYCSDLTSVEYDWGNYLVGGGNQCYNYNYGNSVNIANCAGDFCACFFFSEPDCPQGEYYATLQNAGYDSSAQWEWNCLLNEACFRSMQCFYFGTYQDTTYP